MARMHWAKIKVKKMKRQNKTQSVGVHCKKKNKIFKQCHQNNISTVLIKTIFYLRRGNTRREFIRTCKY